MLGKEGLRLTRVQTCALFCPFDCSVILSCVLFFPLENDHTLVALKNMAGINSCANLTEPEALEIPSLWNF